MRWVVGGSLLALVLAACTSDQPASTTSSSPAPVVTVTSTSEGSPTTTVPSSSSTAAPTTTTTTVPITDLRLRLARVGEGFDHPVLFVASPDGGSDLVIEQPGRIVRHDEDSSTVLDISGDVLFAGEQGLLGFAAHPGFADNGLVYLYYTAPGPVSVVAEMVMSGGTIDPASRTEILRIPQPAPNHNGGMIAFGPDDLLWIGLGDGGASDDKFGNGQDPTTLLGSMIRIAVGPEHDTYAVPADNPFVSSGEGAPEVWATGLRNPWRFAFDGSDLWIADVGQGRWEEVNVVDAATAGVNYGWSVMEGSECFRDGPCDTTGLILPIAEYEHPRGCSITGGVVYRGDAIPSLRGHFLYADYCTGLFASVDRDGVSIDWTDQVGVVGSITGFGTGSDGEVYAVTHEGDIFRVEGDG